MQRLDIRKQVLQKGEIIPLTFDYVFTSIFNNKKNLPILEHFIACYFDVPVSSVKKHIELMPRNLELESKRAKNKQVDLILNMNGEKINIELSNRVSEGVLNRNLVYACNIHGRQLLYGDNTYRGIKKTIQINLNRKSNNKDFKEVYYLRNERGVMLTEMLEIDMIDMEKGREMCYTPNETKLARWCSVLLARNQDEFQRALEGLMEEEEKNRLQYAVEQYSKDSEVVALYSAYTREELERNTFIEEAKEEAKREALKEGLEEGFKQGVEQQNIKLAKEMKKNGISTDMIQKITGLSLEKINSVGI